MKKLQVVFYAIVFIGGTMVFTGCSQGKQEEQSEEENHDEMMGGEDLHMGGEDHSGDDHSMSMETGEDKTWTPSGNGAELMRSDFHFLAGAATNIKPEVKNAEGAMVLELTADGTPTAFVFHNQYDNVGMIATLKRLDFKGSVKIIHHAKDLSNYEFVAIDGANMKLGRVVNGKEEVFDESNFEAGSGWMPLKVTAAGTHFKGYMGDQTITHGHGDKMEKGFIGIMLEGTGKVQLKSIETAILEDE
jgi:hypothetical protein|tara:strand:+ start:473 stop:1210 length:738 start_codon:yes stop_codon:yes gene_type:complete